MPAIPPLALDRLEPPDLRRRPTRIVALHMAHHMALAVWALLLLLPLQPPLLQELVGDVLRGDEPALALDVAEHPVLVVAPLQVQAALLRRPLEPARGHLVDVDVHLALGVGVLRHVQGHGGGADGLAREPADALQRERRVDRVGVGFVLREGAGVSPFLVNARWAIEEGQ